MSCRNLAHHDLERILIIIATNYYSTGCLAHGLGVKGGQGNSHIQLGLVSQQFSADLLAIASFQYAKRLVLAGQEKLLESGLCAIPTNCWQCCC